MYKLSHNACDNEHMIFDSRTVKIGTLASRGHYPVTTKPICTCNIDDMMINGRPVSE